MTKRYFISGIVVVILFICSCFFYAQQYHIEKQAIQTELKDFLNRTVDNGRNLDPKMVKLTGIDDSDTYIGMFATENELGYVVLKKGVNGKFKIDHAGISLGGDNIEYRTAHTNKGDYGLVIGRNTNGSIKIVNVKVPHQNYSYQVNVSGDKFFIKFHKMPEKLDRIYPAELTF